MSSETYNTKLDGGSSKRTLMHSDFAGLRPDNSQNIFRYSHNGLELSGHFQSDKEMSFSNSTSRERRDSSISSSNLSASIGSLSHE